MSSSASSPHLALPAKEDSERLLEFCAAVPENSAESSKPHLEIDEAEELGEETSLLQSHTIKVVASSSGPSEASSSTMTPSKQHEVEPVVLETTHVQPKKSGDSGDGSSGNEQTSPGAPEIVGGDEAPAKKWRWFNYLSTKQFWIVLVLGQVLALCITSTNTFSGLLANKGTSMPAFQTFFNYVLLNIVYSTYTIYRYGFKNWGKLILKDGWRYFILAFMDVEGNYFVVLAYRYTTILSAQLINFWAIVVVVIISLIFLHVRYHVTQYLGILICVGGMGLLLASDHITGSNGGPAVDAVKGDLFALLGASFYGLSNCFEEFLVSKRPMYEVVGQLAFWGMLINGTQAGIFDRTSIRTAVWDGQVIGYVIGYTLMLFIFYSLAPLFFRLTSAAFFNISLLTGNFWGVCIGVKVFHLHIHWMYPIAFVLIIIGHFAYYLTESVLGEAKKPWLGDNQEEGVSGVGTARRRLENPDAIV